MKLGSLDFCIHGGTKYRDGDYFPPNRTYIKTDGPLECVQCRCQHGLVVCEIENCTALDCDNPVKQSRFCCLQCSGNVKSTQGPSDFIFSQTSSDSPPGKKLGVDCVSNGQNYVNGSVWQPVIGPFGEMACVQCQCREGNVICSRLHCNDQPCSHPKREFGECCPICPPTYKLPGNKDTFVTSCLPKLSEIFIYMTRNIGNDTNEVVFAFLENEFQERRVTLYIWNMKPKESSDALVIKTTTFTDMEQLNLELLGSVSQKRYKKFVQRGEKLRTKCFVQCLRKIRRLENFLGIVPAAVKKECSDDEIDVRSISTNMF
ncbi:hypothetical protein RUM43_005463 [Polyplax serrata]|uniref:VWFC domain-containing protein n=1 Tax=Polyplax serrata TaxID=468196 RepID=A0AAN8NQ83_POLSC